MKRNKLPRVTGVKYLGGYRLELTFDDGVRGPVDLEQDIVGKGGVFAPLEDPDFFIKVRVNEGTIEWPNGVDFCPDVLYGDVTNQPVPGATPEWNKQRARQRARVAKPHSGQRSGVARRS